MWMDARYILLASIEMICWLCSFGSQSTLSQSIRTQWQDSCKRPTYFLMPSCSNVTNEVSSWRWSLPPSSLVMAGFLHNVALLLSGFPETGLWHVNSKSSSVGQETMSQTSSGWLYMVGVIMVSSSSYSSRHTTLSLAPTVPARNLLCSVLLVTGVKHLAWMRWLLASSTFCTEMRLIFLLGVEGQIRSSSLSWFIFKDNKGTVLFV